MREYQLTSIISDFLQNALTGNPYNFTNLEVIQSNNPNIVGTNKNTTVYFFRVGAEIPYGFMGHNENYNNNLSLMEREENQYYEVSYQFGALTYINPSDITPVTPSDIIRASYQAFNSLSAIEYFSSQGIGILKVKSIQDVFFTDDQDQFQAFPSFDIIFSYKNTITTSVPVVQSLNATTKII